MKLTPGKNQPEHDLVFTPRILAKQIIDYFPLSGKVLDPAKGDGAFYDQINTEKDWCEISEGRDFFEWKEKVDWIITNPPWSLMRKFLQHGMSIADNIVYLTTINHYVTKARIRDMQKMNFSLKEIVLIDTPKEWPQSGFQLAAVHTQKDYAGHIKWKALTDGN